MLKFDISRAIIDNAINKLSGSMKRIKYLTFNDKNILFEEERSEKNSMKVSFNQLLGIYLILDIFIEYLIYYLLSNLII
jgi:hypothetical protein